MAAPPPPAKIIELNDPSLVLALAQVALKPTLNLFQTIKKWSREKVAAEYPWFIKCELPPNREALTSFMTDLGVENDHFSLGYMGTAMFQDGRPATTKWSTLLVRMACRALVAQPTIDNNGNRVQRPLHTPKVVFNINAVKESGEVVRENRVGFLQYDEARSGTEDEYQLYSTRTLDNWEEYGVLFATEANGRVQPLDLGAINWIVEADSLKHAICAFLKNDLARREIQVGELNATVEELRATITADRMTAGGEMKNLQTENKGLKLRVAALEKDLKDVNDAAARLPAAAAVDDDDGAVPIQEFEFLKKENAELRAKYDKASKALDEAADMIAQETASSVSQVLPKQVNFNHKAKIKYMMNDPVPFPNTLSGNHALFLDHNSQDLQILQLRWNTKMDDRFPIDGNHDWIREWYQVFLKWCDVACKYAPYQTDAEWRSPSNDLVAMGEKISQAIRSAFMKVSISNYTKAAAMVRPSEHHENPTEDEFNKQLSGALEEVVKQSASNARRQGTSQPTKKKRTLSKNKRSASANSTSSGNDRKGQGHSKKHN